jgi:hypothetical protein
LPDIEAVIPMAVKALAAYKVSKKRLTAVKTASGGIAGVKRRRCDAPHYGYPTPCEVEKCFTMNSRKTREF